MLRQTGPVERRKQYDRIPMADEIGEVIAYSHHTYIHYRPKDGSHGERLTRAEILAVALRGTVILWGPERAPMVQVAWEED